MVGLRCLVVALALATVPQLPAATIALTFTGGTVLDYSAEPLPNTVGWQFELASPVTITSLGFYDVNQDGLIFDHSVAIWDLSENELVSGVVSNFNPLVDGFRWVDVSPILLAAGTYRIGAVIAPLAVITLDDQYVGGAASVTTAAPVTHLGAARLLGGFGYPADYSEGSLGRFGPNFQFESVPEPATSGILAFGLAALAVLRRRRGRVS